MKLFSLIQLQYDKFEQAIRNYLSTALGDVNTNYSNSSIFSQIINVVSSVTQNILSYIEDGITEQNKYTAERKRSIYHLAAISGYHPSMGTATTALLSMSYKPNNTEQTTVILKNHTKVYCDQTGLNYNIILPQEALVLNPARDNSTKYLTVVEGVFETQSFAAEGGQLYTSTIRFAGQSDIDYLEVSVNDERWERCESIYDMDPEGKQYVARTSLSSGFDIIFGDSQNGKVINRGDKITVSYLIHSGEIGNIDINSTANFTFADNLTDVAGENVNGNDVFVLTLESKNSISSGTDSDSVLKVRELIGMNSRSLVLADPKNYKAFFKRFSFVGYNRTWSEKGSLIINSIVLKNYKNLIKNGKDYFKLHPSDFILSDTQKMSLINNIKNSGQQLAGSVVNIFDPEIVKYAMYVYIKPKSNSYDTTYISDQIHMLVGQFFSDINNDIFIPKSDITKLIKDNVDGVDGVDVYFLSQLNEEAMINHKYTNKTYTYDPSRGTYNIKEEQVYLYDGENPNLGLDAHGNIYLDNTDQFPVIMGGWKFISSQPGEAVQYTTIDPSDPITIVFE